MLDQFKTDIPFQHSIASSIDLLAKLCAAASAASGFQDDERKVRKELASSIHLPWVEDAILQAELARQISELGEAIEAVRKPGPDSHLPEFDGLVVEEADCIIRIADTMGKRHFRLGDAVVAKLLYNLSRPYKHGKRS